MGRNTNAGYRNLLLFKYLFENTDQNHSVTRKDIDEFLATNGIIVDRKTIYSDMDTMELFGHDIQLIRGNYSLVSREFEPQEVKLLADMVQSSNFITKNKSETLIKKLETLVSKYEALELNKQIVARNRVKSSNEQMFISIDKISAAISENRSILFKYFKYDMAKKKAYQHNGENYHVSPFALISGEDNYYLLAYYHEAKELRHYRVDRMDNIRITKNDREGCELFSEVDINNYPTMVFNMFRGPQHNATLSFRKELVDTVMDRFGKEVMPIPDGENWFHINVEVMESPQFFAWMSGFGSSAEIKAPEELRQHMKEHLQNTLKQYES